MRSIKTRLRPDNIPNEQRVMRGKTGRTIYLVLLALFGLGLLNYLFGDFLLLDADGLVLRDEHVIATPYIARLEQVDITEGQSVDKGTPLLTLQSTELLERLADLSTKRAELVAKATDFKIRSENVTQLLPLAERRTKEAVNTMKQFDNLADARLVTSARYQEALRVNYEASKDKVSLLTQRKVLQEELTSLDKALADADDAIAKLQDVYANGVVSAPVNGSIGASVPSVGNVYRAGDPILSVYSGESYVLAYLPRRYLFPISVGMNVQISDGRDITDGVVTEILPVTDTLPKEFQNTFKPSDRSQLAKIKLDGPSPFPLNQKVNISRYSSLSGALLGVRKRLGLGGGSQTQAAAAPG
jgi:multidrug resistance efflux pump